MGIKCGGYSPPQETAQRQTSTAKRAIVPQIALQNLQPLSEMALFGSSKEYQRFKLFSEKLQRQGGHGVLLQICQTDPLLRRAVLALAAFEKSKVARSHSGNEGRRSTISPGYVEAESPIENGTIIRDHKKAAETTKEFRQRRRQLLSYLHMLCFEDILAFHNSESHKAYMKAPCGNWSRLLDRKRRRSIMPKLNTIAT